MAPVLPVPSVWAGGESNDSAAVRVVVVWDEKRGQNYVSGLFGYNVVSLKVIFEVNGLKKN